MCAQCPSDMMALLLEMRQDIKEVKDKFAEHRESSIECSTRKEVEIGQAVKDINELGNKCRALDAEVSQLRNKGMKLVWFLSGVLAILTFLDAPMKVKTLFGW